jgi:hypothetical protein
VDGTLAGAVGAATTWLETLPLVAEAAGGATAGEGVMLETTLVRGVPEA